MHANSIINPKTGDTLLHQAVQKNDLEKIADLIKKGADVRVKNLKGTSPLHRARSSEVAELLIKNGANVNVISSFDTPLHRAVERKNFEVVKTLLIHGAYLEALNGNKKTPLDIAYDHNNEEMIELLLKAKSSSGSPESMAQLLVKERLKTQNNPTLILFSLCKENQWIELINEIFIDQLIKNKEELLQAVMNELINTGANINEADQNNNSNTPLHTAIEILKARFCHDHLHVCKYIEYLLKNNPDLELQNGSQKTALQLASEIAGNATTTSSELIESRQKVQNMIAASDKAKLANNNSSSTLYLDLERKLSIKDDKSEEAAPK